MCNQRSSRGTARYVISGISYGLSASFSYAVSTFRLHHIQQLLALLKQHLLQHNYTPAGQIMQTLVHASDLVPDTCRNVCYCMNVGLCCVKSYNSLFRRLDWQYCSRAVIHMPSVCSTTNNFCQRRTPNMYGIAQKFDGGKL